MKENPNMIPIAAKVPVELAEAVARMADAGDRSVSGEIRRAIREHVDRSGGLSSFHRPSPVERGAPESPAAEAPLLAGDE